MEDLHKAINEFLEVGKMMQRAPEERALSPREYFSRGFKSAKKAEKKLKKYQGHNADIYHELFKKAAKCCKFGMRGQYEKATKLSKEISKLAEQVNRA
ncbi:hypothetical protein [Cytobacillus sp. FSL K6-0129]|uniref:hypothetical protein n=1 Tax=Cytobacillus TaxID=2675230 RepID=UPI0030F56085